MAILKDKTRRGRLIAITILAGCVIGVLCFLQMPQKVMASIDQAFAATSTEVHYYAQDVPGDGHEFGPYGSSKDDLLKRIDPNVNPAPDPALAAAILYDAQYKFSQNFTGQNINPANAQAEINALHGTFRNDRNAWKDSVNKYRAFLDGCQVNIEDNIQYNSQMYMMKTGASFDANAPVVVWQQTGAPGGPEWLVICRDGKKQELHLSCGYQPGADIYIVAQAHPEQYTPPTPTPTPDPIKDPSKDPVYQGNAQRGGGYNTNPDGSIDWSPGEYQPTRPEWQPSGGGSSSGGDSGGGSSGGKVTPTPAPVTPVQPAKPGTKDGGDQGEFK